MLLYLKGDYQAYNCFQSSWPSDNLCRTRGGLRRWPWPDPKPRTVDSPLDALISSILHQRYPQTTVHRLLLQSLHLILLLDLAALNRKAQQTSLINTTAFHHRNFTPATQHSDGALNVPVFLGRISLLVIFLPCRVCRGSLPTYTDVVWQGWCRCRTRKRLKRYRTPTLKQTSNVDYFLGHPKRITGCPTPMSTCMAKLYVSYMIIAPYILYLLRKKKERDPRNSLLWKL